MCRINLSSLLLLALPVTLAAQTVEPDKPGTLNLPATAIERVENNPAKAAVLAREAQKKEEGAEKAEATAKAVAGVDAAARTDATPLSRSVEEALRKDPRTARLAITTAVTADGAIALRGKVPSRQARTAAASVAATAAGAAALRNELTISAK